MQPIKQFLKERYWINITQLEKRLGIPPKTIKLKNDDYDVPIKYIERILALTGGYLDTEGNIKSGEALIREELELKEQRKDFYMENKDVVYMKDLTTDEKRKILDDRMAARLKEEIKAGSIEF